MMSLCPLTRLPPIFADEQEYPILDEALKAFAASQMRRRGNASFGVKPGHGSGAFGASPIPQIAVEVVAVPRLSPLCALSVPD